MAAFGVAILNAASCTGVKPPPEPAHYSVGIEFVPPAGRAAAQHWTTSGDVSIKGRRRAREKSGHLAPIETLTG